MAKMKQIGVTMSPKFLVEIERFAYDQIWYAGLVGKKVLVTPHKTMKDQYVMLDSSMDPLFDRMLYKRDVSVLSAEDQSDVIDDIIDSV